MSIRTAHSARTLAPAAALVLAALLLVAPTQARALTNPLQSAVPDGPSTPSARALGAMSAKLPAPNFDSCYGGVGSACLEWDLDYGDSGDNPISSDEELIDHFNVYCDERLVAQVDISAAEEAVWFNDGSAIVRWADPVFSTATVIGWELYRRPEHGLAAKVGEFASDVHEYADTDVLEGWTYEYYVVARTDEGDRRSATASRLITTSTQSGAPGAPAKLAATVVNGRVVLSWERPAYEGYIRWYMAEFKYPGNDEWVILSDQGSSRYVLGRSEGMTIENVDDLVDKDMQVRVWAENDGGEGERSNVASFKITSKQAAAHVPGAPGAVAVSGEAGDGWCKVTWSTSTAKNKPPATEYRIMRYDSGRAVYYRIGTVAAKGEGAYDYTYVDRSAENGESYRYMVIPANCGTEALVDANYDYVTLEPTGKLYDQQVAEAVAEIITSLPTPDDVTLGDAGLIREVAEIWENLSGDQRKLVKRIDKALPAKLSEDVEAVEELELLVEYADIVAPVQALIDALPDPSAVALNDKDQVAAARAAFEAITPEEAKRPVKKKRLTDDEERIVALEKEAAEAARIDIVAGKVALSATTFTYNGKAKTPDVVLVVDGTQLKAGVDYRVAYTDNVNAGKATVTLTGIGAYKGTSKTTFSIAKAANPLTVKGKTAKVKAGKLAKKKMKLAVSKVMAFTVAGEGEKTYVKKSGSKRISINNSTGKVTVKKRTKKGTYKVTVAVTAGGNANYKAAIRKIQFIVKVS